MTTANLFNTSRIFKKFIKLAEKNLTKQPKTFTRMEASSNYTISKKGQDLYLVPKDGKHTETLIFMHGLGDSAAGWFDIFMESSMNIVLPTTKVVLLTAPIAPVTINGGAKMTSWYDIKTLAPKDEEFEKSIGAEEIEKNSERITNVILEEMKLLGDDSKRIAIGGFSQGCGMALNVGLQFDKPLGAIIGWSGYLFPMTKFNAANEETPIILANGMSDNVVGFARAQKSFERLDAGKHKLISLKEKGLGHSINENVLKETRKFFASIFSNTGSKL